ncbi:MAG TPA: CBS domain-containing protein [Polyangiaceae bacterium]|nr:CBS domain-containing protein [Polyangiaceae bacterium]
MAKLVRELMSKPLALPSSAPVVEAARQMQNEDVGTVIVEDGGKPFGIVTDRDIVVRVVAEGRDPAQTAISEVCSKELVTLSPDAELDLAVQLMRDRAVRRLLVVNGEHRTVGLISLGDLAIERDPNSVLGQISATPPNS